MAFRIADLFCGAGGTSEGAVRAGAKLSFGLNHWSTAVQTHAANFPNAKHVNSRLENTNPGECGRIEGLFASPECTHFSRARGDRPTSDQQRCGAWYIFPWIDYHRPRWVIVENVVEFRDWGPVNVDTGQPLKSKRGAYFDNWLRNFWAAGYRVDIEELNAANFGARTSRNRLFIIARRGNRNPVFPEPTHTRTSGGELPGMGLPGWRSAAEIIDWSIPCPSVFWRKRPLADKTLLRIEAGLRRFVGPFVAQFNEGSERRTHSINGPLATVTANGKKFALVQPYQVVLRNNMDVGRIEDPLNTITAGGGHHGIAMPFMADVNHAGGNRVQPLNEVLGTLTTHNGKALVTPFVLSTGSSGAPRYIDQPIPTIVTQDGTALCVPFQFQLIGRGAGKARSIESSVPTILAARENHGIVLPWLSPYYGNSTPSDVSTPLDTITTKERHSLCVAMCKGPEDWPAAETDAMRLLQATMRQLGVCDIGFRMLQNPELAAAQGFPEHYIFHGSKADVTRQIGNSVSPNVAEAITKTILSV